MTAAVNSSLLNRFLILPDSTTHLKEPLDLAREWAKRNVLDAVPSASRDARASLSLTQHGAEGEAGSDHSYLVPTVAASTQPVHRHGGAQPAEEEASETAPEDEDETEGIYLIDPVGFH